MGGMFGKRKTSTISTSEPRLGAIQVQQSSYGLVVPIVYGQTRVTGNLLWYGDFTAIPHVTRTESGGGGKGGGGGKTVQEDTSYTYEAALLMGLGEGPINAVVSAWRGKERLRGGMFPGALHTVNNESSTIPATAPYQVSVAQAAGWVAHLSATTSEWVEGEKRSRRVDVVLSPGSDFTVSNGVYTFNSRWASKTVLISYQWRDSSYYLSALQQLGLALQPGVPGQAPWGHLLSRHPEQAIGYSQTAVLYGANYQLTNNAEVQNHSFEVVGNLPFGQGVLDANPADVLVDLLSNPRHGAGFPSGKLGNLSRYRDYCTANGLFVSPAYHEQRQAHEHLQELAMLSNSALLWSEGQLKVLPYGDEAANGWGAQFLPDLTPVYALTDDDFLVSGADDPVRVQRKTPADAFNQVQVEFLNRSNDYNLEVAEAKDLANIEQFGLRPQEPVKLHAICEPAVARHVAQLLLQRALYVRNHYEFRLGWRHALLEPMDLVTLTDSGLGLLQAPVRVTSIEEDEDGGLTVRAEDFPRGAASSARYPTQVVTGFGHDFNADPGKVLPPLMFEPAFAGEDRVLRVKLAVTGPGVMWGGCLVYASQDGTTFKQVDRIVGGSRYGVLRTALTATDTSLSVQLTGKGGQMLSGTAEDARLMHTACWVDGEYLGYQQATLDGVNQYTLGGLQRGSWNTTPASHPAGSPFVRLGATVGESEPLSLDQVGKTLWFKLVSFNVYGGGLQDISEVPAYQYTVQGTALLSPMPDIRNVHTNFVAGLTQIYWDPVQDLRPVDYEVRLGPTWHQARVLGRTPLPRFTAVGDGLYWIAAHYQAQGGVQVYSAQPGRLSITGAALVKNVVARFDEAASGWPGSCSGGAMLLGGAIQLDATGNLLTLPDVLADPDILWLGGVAGSGVYTLPTSHTINIGRVAACNVLISYNVRGQAIHENLLTTPDIFALSDWFGEVLGQQVDVVPQIALAQEDGVFGDWQQFVPGSYVAQSFKARVLISSRDPGITPVLSGLTFLVDAPDRVDSGSANVPAGGFSVLYDRPFNGGNGSQPWPLPQITLLNAMPGDDLLLTAQTRSGFTVRVVNGATDVARQINWISQGY